MAEAQPARTVDVVIPTRDTRQLTLACVDSVLRESSPDLAVRCVVVDNGSTDGTAEALAGAHPDARVVRNPENLGFGTACNQGARQSDGDYLLILNSDIVVRPGGVRRLAGFLDSHPEFVAAGGRLVDTSTGETQVGFTVRAFPRVSSQVALMLGLERFWPRNPISRRQLMLDFDYDRTQPAEQPAGACLICRRAGFDSAGGFDEGFFYWFEDVDLVRRLAARGAVGYVHDAVFEHVGSATFEAWDRPDVIMSRYHGLLRYFDKHHPRRDRLVLHSVVSALAMIRALAWLPFDRSRACAYARVARMAARRLHADGATGA